MRWTASSWRAWKPLDLLNAITPERGSERIAGIEIGRDPRQRLDVHRPRAAPRGGPVIVFFYGGSWQRGDRADYAFVGRALASRGFTTLIPDYRIYPPHGFPSFLEDGAAAVRWAREHAAELGADPQRLFLMGHSAGAHIAAMLSVEPRWLASVELERDVVRGMIGVAGPYDFLPLRDPALKALFGPEERLVETQPVSHVRGGEPPLMLLHGGADRVVGVRNSRRLAKRVRDHGGEADLVVYPRVGHGGILAAIAAPLQFWAPVVRDVARFVDGRGRS